MTDGQIDKLLDAIEEAKQKHSWNDDLPELLRQVVRAQLAAPAAPEVWCGCGDKIMPDDGARCGTCVAVKTAFPQGERN